MTKLDEDLIYQICSIIEEIPYGKVATYGQIAQLSGHEKNARLVGKILAISELYGNFPCHRVVSSSGRLAPHFTSQRTLLEQEGITFKSNGHVDLSKHQWLVK